MKNNIPPPSNEKNLKKRTLVFCSIFLSFFVSAVVQAGEYVCTFKTTAPSYNPVETVTASSENEAKILAFNNNSPTFKNNVRGISCVLKPSDS